MQFTNESTGVSWHPYSPHAQIASGSHDGTVKVWDLRSSLPLFTLTHHTDKVLCVDWAGIMDTEAAKGKEEAKVTRFDLVSGGGMLLFRCFAIC